MGCAFAICLEKKQERDKLCSVSMKFDKNDSSFTRYGSFRQATLTERLQDPQVSFSTEFSRNIFMGVYGGLTLGGYSR